MSDLNRPPDLDTISIARRLLITAASDARSKIFNFAGVLLAISDALGELQRRSDATRTELDRRIPPPRIHPAGCECKPCALARMVERDRLENP